MIFIYAVSLLCVCKQMCPGFCAKAAAGKGKELLDANIFFIGRKKRVVYFK